jgi:hypothetical protein
MSLPDTKVFIAFDLAAGGVGDFFTLNDSKKGFFSGTRENLAENPSFEVDTARWNGVDSTITRVSDWSQFGSHSLRIRPSSTSTLSFAELLTSGGSNNVVSILEPGKAYTVSGYVNTPVALSGSLFLFAQRIQIRHRVGSGTFTSVATGRGLNPGSGRVAITYQIPSDVTEVQLRLYNGATNSATNDVFWDAILIEEAERVFPFVDQSLPYFDGSTLDGPVAGVTSWSGTPHASTSTVLFDNTFGLAGDILQDVTEDVRSVSVRRGRSRALERFDAGAAVVDLRNDERKFDPAAGTAITPFGASMRPRKQVVIQTEGASVFSGVVEDWDLQYSLNNDHIASVKVTDEFAILAQQVLPPFGVVTQSAGDRVSAVLDRPSVAWPEGRRDISPGKATMGTAVIEDDVTVLEYLQQVELSEPGGLFIGSNGVFVFRGRDDFQKQTEFTFADNGQGVPFQDISISYGIEEMRNRVTVELASEGGTATAINNASVVEYGAIDFLLGGSLVSTVGQAQNLADYLVNIYGQPQVRVDSLTVNLSALSGPQTTRVLGLELGDVVRVLFTPSGIGDQIQQVAVIDAIEHDIVPGEHVLRFDLSEARIGLTLDSAELGVLDVHKLGF